MSKRRRSLQILVLACLTALVLATGFYLGQRAAYSGMGVDPKVHRELKKALPQAKEEIARLEGELDVELTRHEVDRQALEMVRKDIATQKDKITELEEGLGFYKSLMSPGEIAQGLSLRPLELIAREAPGQFGFRIVVQQEARKHELIKGSLYAEITGTQGEQQARFPLAQLTEDIEDAVVSLRFRYFQSIEGELTLPEGFEPGSVSLVVTATKPRKTEVREVYPWQAQERFTHVGK